MNHVMLWRPALSGGPRFYGLKRISNRKSGNAYLLADLGVAQALLVKLYNLSLSVSVAILK
jgi:hypothetical protein